MAIHRPEGPRIKKIGGGYLARYQHLPLYQSCYGLCLHVYRLRVGFPKTIKHDLGSQFFESAVRCVKAIVVANGQENKIRYIQILNLEFETLWLFSRLLYDLKAISQGEFQVLSKMLSEIGPQIQAWLKWERQNKKSKHTASTK